MSWVKTEKGDHQLRVFVRPDNEMEAPCIAVINLYSGNGAKVPDRFLEALESAIREAVDSLMGHE